MPRSKSNKTRPKKRFIIDASPLASDRTSGVGHSVYGFIKGLTEDPDFTAHYRIYLVAPARGMKYVKALGFNHVSYRPILLPARVWNRLPGTPLMPFMDLFLGRGVYFLTNFRSWPLLRSKSMVMIHDVAFRLYPETLTHRHRNFLERNIPRWIKRANLVLTVSKSAKQDILHQLPVRATKLAVLYNGVDTALFAKKCSDEVAAVATKYGLPKDYILYVGNFEPRKNLSRLIAAYEELPKRLRDHHPLVLVGGSSWLNGQLDSQIEEAAARGVTVIRPHVYIADSDLPAVYSGASAFAWPTLHEGFGMPLLEAMAVGVPVLTARNSSLPEVAGEAALYVDAENINDIRDGLTKLLTDKDLRRTLSAAGLARAQEFSWAKSAQTITRLASKLSAGL